jgi:hypothetical protein
MKYYNKVQINGDWYTNTIEADNYKEALKKHAEQKRKSKNKFKGRLEKGSF